MCIVDDSKAFPRLCYACRDTSWILFSVETITIGDKKIGIRTSVLEEKATACNMLCCYADELKEGFYPWIDQVKCSLAEIYPYEPCRGFLLV